jgi:hypothetical protein
MSTIIRSITIDISNARYLREKAIRFKEAAEAETRPEVADRYYKQVAFLIGQAEYFEARAKRWQDECTAMNMAKSHGIVSVKRENLNEH